MPTVLRDRGDSLFRFANLMMRSAQSVFAALLLISAGCATRGNVELLESQLRQQEDTIYAAQAERERAESELRIAQREVQALRVQLADQGKKTLLPEQAKTLYRVAGVRVNEWFSGGLDRDDRPGDEQLNILLTPHDEQGETVKLPGQVTLEVIDLSAPESSRELGVWKFSDEQVADSWQSGLTSGFQLRVPLEHPPVSENIVLHARFATVDGRQFQTTADLRVTPGETQNTKPLLPSPPSPTLRTSVKPIDPPSPQAAVIEESNSGNQKPTMRPAKDTGGKVRSGEFFPVRLASDEKPVSKTHEKRVEKFFPEPSIEPPKPTAVSEPSSKKWGWKPLDSFEEKIPPANFSEDFQRRPNSPTDASELNRETRLLNLPSSEDGDQKPF